MSHDAWLAKRKANLEYWRTRQTDGQLKPEYREDDVMSESLERLKREIYTGRNAASGVVGDAAFMVDGACRGMNPDLFHPDQYAPKDASYAKAVCVACPVKTECADYAIANGARCQGVWGGLSEQERNQIRRATGKVA